MEETDEKNWYADDAATFGDRLAAAREGRGMNQKALARRLGVALKTVEGWENDLREPRANKLQMLAGVLNVSLPWLLTGEGQGVEVDADSGPVAISDILTEMRLLRTQMQGASEKLAVLEKNLKKAVSEVA